MHKTASSSCQQLFAEKRDELAETGLRYFEGPDDNHSFFLLSLFDINRPYFNKLKASGYLKSEYSDHDALAERFKTFVAETEGDALLSAESAFLLSAEQVRELREEHLKGSDLKVLAFIRPPLSFARSAAQQSFKGGQTFAKMMDSLPIPKYRTRFAQYVDVLGRDNVLLEVFHRKRMKDGDPAQTLLAMMGRNNLPDLRAPNRNPSMSAIAAKLLSIMNAALEDPTHLNRIPAEIRAALRALPADRYEYADLENGTMKGGLLVRRLMRLIQRMPGKPFKLPVEIRDAAIEASRKDDAWVSKMLGMSIGRFDSEIEDDAPLLADAEKFNDDELPIALKHLQAAPRTWRDLVPQAAA